MLFERGHEKFIPAFILNNCIENLFSLTGGTFKKLTALSMKQVLREISLDQFQTVPKNGNYALEVTVEQDLNFLDLLQRHVSEENGVHESNIEFPHQAILVEINDEITPATLFKNDFTHNCFVSEISEILARNISRIECHDCIDKLKNEDESPTTGNTLLLCKKEIAETSLIQPSQELLTFYMRLEYIFMQLSKDNSSNSATFCSNFLMSAELTFFPYEHCPATTEFLTFLFIKERKKMNLQQYMPHKANKFSSKGLI